MTTVNNTPTTPPTSPPEPMAPSQLPDDAVENNALYQAFLDREADGTPNPDDDLAPDPTTVEPVDSGEGGSVAPSASSPDANEPPPDPSGPADLPEGFTPDLLPPTGDSPVTPAVPQLYEINGTQYTQQQIDQILEAAQWTSQINPAQAQFIDGVLSGQIPFDPQQLVHPNAPGQPSPVTPVTEPVDDGYEYADPRLKAEMDDLRALVQQQATLTQQQLAAAHQTQMAETTARINTGAEQFQQKFNLTPEERDNLMQSAVTLQVIPQIGQRQKDPSLAIQEAMEIAFWATPEYRDRYVQQQATQQQQVVEQDVTRKTKASSLASSGGSVPRVPVAQPLTAEGRRKAMAGEIAASMNGTQV